MCWKAGMMCAMPDDMRWSIVMVITEDLGAVCESNAVGMGHMGHGAIGALAWDSALARPDARYRPSTRFTAVGTTRIESAYVSAARARPAGVCAWRWRWRPRRLPDRGLYDASFFSSAHSHDSHCRAAHSRFGNGHCQCHSGARPRQRSRGRGHAGPVTR